MGGFQPSYFFISLGFFIIRMTRYYFPLLSVNFLSVKLSLKSHLKIVGNLLSIALPSFLTHIYVKKEGSAIDDKFPTMFKCDFRESLTLRRLTESKGSNTLSFL